MKVYLIGAGPGDPGLFTLKGKDILGKADTVIYDYLANDVLLTHVRQGAELIYAGKKGGDHTLSQEAINALIIAKAREGKTVARLKGGDPYMFGRGGEEAEELLEAGIPFEVVPGVTSAIAGPAYAGIPLTHRAHASSVCFATGHEDPTKPDTAHNWHALATGGSTLVFFMGMKNLPDISRKLIDAGMAADTPAALINWGTTTRHRSLVSTIESLPQEAVANKFTAPSLIVVGSVVSLHDKLNWFEKQPLFGKTIVVTRAREQASDTANLLAREGANVIQFPTIDILPVKDTSKIRGAIAALGTYQWVIFTSINSVHHFWDQIKALGLDARIFGQGQGIKVAAIGPATAEGLRKKGITPDFIPKTYVAESVAEGLINICGKSLDGMRILLPRALVAREVLPETLRVHKAVVDVLPVYETHLCDSHKEEVLEGLASGTIDCITFGSSSTVTNFFSLIPAQMVKECPAVQLACIGPVTAKTLTEKGLSCHIQPAEYTASALVREIVGRL